MEGRGGIKLQELQQWRRESYKKVGGTMGKKAPFYMEPQMWPLGTKKNSAPTARPRAGLGPAWLGRNHKRPALARPELGLGWPNCRKTSNTKTNIF